MIRRIYSIFGVLITPLLHLWLRHRAGRGKEIAARLSERFGHALSPRPAGKLVWLHAASVGEVQSALLVLRELLQRNTTMQVLITTGTVTSAQLVAAQQLPRTIHQFIPVDTYPAVRRFLRHWQPHLVMWMESELWPQLLWQIGDRHLPALLLNARISAKTAANWRRWPRTIRSLWAVFSAIYAGSVEDANRLRALGAADVREVGNLKYDAAPLAADDAALAEFRQQIGQRPLWLAASTHADEEQRSAAIHTALLQQFPTLLTIIVPRHAHRGDDIAAALRDRGIALSQRSKNESISPQTGIYLADTMGELGVWYRLADIVFIGGSLVPHGGHNPLEPARVRCAVLIGPHRHNFSDMVAQMQAEQAIIPVQDEADLCTAIEMLLRNKMQRDMLIQNAENFVHSRRGAAAAIVQHIDQLLGDA